MKAFKEPNYIANIIAKKILRQTDKKEEHFLDDWKKSEENQLLYEKLTNPRNFKKHDEVISSVDINSGWNKYISKIDESKKRKLIPSVVWYAAAVLLPLVIVTSYLIIINEKQAVPVSAENNVLIEPGTKNAVLLLDDGSGINLEKEESLELQEKDGTRIVKKEGVLNYEKSRKEKNIQSLKNTLLVPRGGEYNLILADGTKVFVNSMSRLEFPVQFSDSTREVSLEGEACFWVAKDAAHPFIVKVNGVKVEVLGTTFNINAYPDESSITTTLVEGKIKMNRLEKPGEEFILSPNDQAVIDSNSGQVKIGKVDADKFIQWVNGVYVFENQTLGAIMKTLGRWYDFNCWFENQDLKEIEFDGRLNKYESIEPILEIIQSTGKVKVEVENNNILFKEKSEN